MTQSVILSKHCRKVERLPKVVVDVDDTDRSCETTRQLKMRLRKLEDPGSFSAC